MMRPQMFALCVAVSACGDPEADAPRAAGPGVATTGTAPASAPGDALTVADLAANLQAKLGETVTLRAQYLNTNSVQTGGKWTVQNIILVEGRGSTQPRVTCMLVDDSKPRVQRMKQYTPLVVEGKVGTHLGGRPRLADCRILSP